MDPLSLFFEKILDFGLKLAGKELGYLLCYKNKVNELKGKTRDLQNKQRTVQEQIDEAERSGKVMIHKDVEEWLQKMNEKLAEIQNEEGGTRTKWSNYDGLIPYSFVRHQRGRRAVKLAEDVDVLLKTADFGEVSYWPSTPTWAESIFIESGYERLDSRIEIAENVINKLKDPSVKTIGIWGQGGVGKTTIVKAVARKAQKMNLFKVVVMATITKNPQIKNIQGQIADMLGMTLREETEVGRAGQIQERLKKEDNTLVILDDLWDHLNLNKLGIPIQDDDSKQKPRIKEKSGDSHGECKILLTSRNKNVLSTHMDVKQNLIYSVEELEEKEAEILFKKVAGWDNKTLEYELLASKIAKRCKGLPVVLVTVGRALKDKSYSVCEDALGQLEKQQFTRLQEPMEFSTKLSYDHLENEELKATFLLCAQMDNDSLIVDLLKYCIGLGILEGVYTIREARGKLTRLIETLKDSSLLLNSYSSDRFTMHDTIRDAALSIAFKEQHAFIKRNVKLDDWLHKDKLEKYTNISLHHCDIVHELPKSIKCPRLKVFQVESKDYSLRIPNAFFERITELRVLVLTGIDLSCMPSSIKCLQDLRMLCLEQCVIGDGLYLIGELKKLRILSLSGSVLKSFQVELGYNLQLLDISNCPRLGLIPPNVISRLNNLEELHMRNNFVQGELEGKTNASLVELSHLHQLTTLDIHIPNLNVFPENLFFDALEYYMIAIGDSEMFSLEGFKMPDQYEASRTLALQLKKGNNIHSQKAIKLLFKSVENLLLGELNEVEDIFYELNLQGFPCLKHLYIANSNDLKYIFNTTNLLLPPEAFTNLESLHLYKLENMEKICCSHLKGSSFCKLKFVKIQMCHKLQNLFSFSMVKLLIRLETIEVSECDALKEIVDMPEQGHSEIEVVDDKVGFHKLKHVTLQGLSKFTSFYTKDDMMSQQRVDIPIWESLKLSSINICNIFSDLHPLTNSNFQSLRKLDVNSCHELEYLVSFSMVGCLVNLTDLEVSWCKKMKELLIQDGDNTTEVDIFPNLKEIKLIDMDNLTEIWHKPGNRVGPQSYCHLESVYIEGCSKLVTVVPPHITGMLKSLDTLEIWWSDSMEVIFDMKNILPTDGEKDTRLRKLEIWNLDNLEHIWNNDPKGILNFNNLQHVDVNSCMKLKNIFPFSVAKALQQLETLRIKGGDEMTEIVDSENGYNTNSVMFEFPKLTSVTLVSLSELRSFYPGKHDIKWPQLKDFDVIDCDKLGTLIAERTNLERLSILSEQVISNLQSLTIGSKGEELLSRCINNYHLNSLKILKINEWKNPEYLFRCLHRTPNLEKLNLLQCDDLQELLPPGMLVAQEKIGTVVQLKNLTLWRMLSLSNIGFEQDPALFRQLQSINIYDCNSLINFAPGSICFTHLTYLQVSACQALINLMESSTAKSLSQLTTLEVAYCSKMQEIVAKKGSKDEREEEIVFPKLTTLELDSLDELTSFCRSEYCSFMFPLLENLVVRNCLKMKKFSEEATKAPKLRKLYFDYIEKGKWYWTDDSNNTIEIKEIS